MLSDEQVRRLERVEGAEHDAAPTNAAWSRIQTSAGRNHSAHTVYVDLADRRSRTIPG